MMKAVAMLLCWGMAAVAAPTEFVGADDSRLHYSDYARMEFAASPVRPGAKLARFDRILDMPRRGYRWDNPGARLRFRTDAASVAVVLYYNDKHTSTSARNPVGIYLVDGRTDPSRTFTTAAKSVVRAPETVVVRPAVPSGGGMHDYDIVLPYGDSVDVQGVEVSSGARFETPSPRPARRLVMYGDSITHGFTARNIGGTYAWHTAARKNLQLIDMGLGGRSSTPGDGAVIAGLQPDLVTVLIGVNDWQGGRPLERFRANLTGFIQSFRAIRPHTPVYFITPLWVPPSWRPKKAATDLEEYRRVIREVVAAARDSALKVVEGPTLIDHDPKLFDRVAVHPNDAGFGMMAERLAAALP